MATTFPALSESRLLRYFSFAMLYVAQGVPEGIMLFAIPAWLAMNGKTAAEVSSYTAIIFLPFGFKILAAPMIERFTFLAMGRRRPWILVGQIGIASSLAIMSLIENPLDHLFLLTIFGICSFFFVIVQDISTDALAIDIVPIDEQAKANGMMWGAKVAGMAGSLAICTWLLNQYGFFTAIFSLSLIVIFIMLVPLLLRERPDEKLLPWTKGKVSTDAATLQMDSFRKIFKSLLRVLKLRNSIILLLLNFLIMMSLGYMKTLIPIFTIQAIGWTNQAYSSVYATTSFAGGILGMVVGGYLVDRFGTFKMMSIYLVLLVSFTGLIGFGEAWWKVPYFVETYIALFALMYTFIIITIFAMVMKCCWKRISAMQFTFYMAAFNLAQTIGSAAIGPIRGYAGWGFTLFAIAVPASAALIILQTVNMKKHLTQVEELEQAEVNHGALAI